MHRNLKQSPHAFGTESELRSPLCIRPEPVESILSAARVIVTCFPPTTNRCEIIEHLQLLVDNNLDESGRTMGALVVDDTTREQLTRTRPLS